MNKLLTPVSRLSLIFLLGIIVPGTILTYFGALHLKNLNDVTEQIIFNEEKQLVNSILDSTQYNLNSIIEFVDEILNQSNNGILSKCYKIEKNIFIDNSFALDENGAFLFPYYVEPSSIILKTNFLGSFEESYHLAEIAEFREKDLIKAEKLYKNLLRQADDPSDSARIFNALARVTYKTKKFEETAEYCMNLLQYSEELDQNGFPYINYIIRRTLDLYMQIGDLSVINVLGQYIDEMIIGEIPLTTTTVDLLNEFYELSADIEISNIAEISGIAEKSNMLKNRLIFVDKYKTVIRELTNNNNVPRNEILNHYFVNPSLDGSLIILIKEYKKSGADWIGFAINQNIFQDYILNGISMDNLKFNYSINFDSDYNIVSSPESKFVMTSKLYPFPSNQIFIVEPREPEKIFAKILRISWLYGVALIALISTMVFGVVLVIRDISRERQLSLIRSDFVSSVTHDLKTPITSIQLFAESILMNRAKNKKDLQEYSQIIIHETTRLKRLINNILDYSKIDNKNFELRHHRIDISELVKRIIKELDYWTKEKNFKINQQIAKGVYANIDIDAFTQALINLISNAIQHSEINKEIWVKLNKNDKYIFVEVKDCGIGIAVNEQEKIFDKFYKIDNNSTGSGLGLFITKQIIEAHGGTITINSEPGKGSMFTIKLNRS